MSVFSSKTDVNQNCGDIVYNVFALAKLICEQSNTTQFISSANGTRESLFHSNGIYYTFSGDMLALTGSIWHGTALVLNSRLGGVIPNIWKMWVYLFFTPKAYWHTHTALHILGGYARPYGLDMTQINYITYYKGICSHALRVRYDTYMPSALIWGTYSPIS